MLLQIGKKTYTASPSFLTMVKYRAEYGQTILQEDLTDAAVLIQLIHTAVTGKKPCFREFFNECVNDGNFPKVATSFCEKLLFNDCPEKTESNGGGESPPDELEILAFCAIANINGELLDILNLFQLIKLIGKYCEVKNPSQAPHEMSTEQRKALYGISPEKEHEIEAYLMAQEKEGL